MNRASKGERDAVGILERLVGEDAELKELIAREAVNAEVAQLIFDARTAAGLTQRDLAERVGTSQSVIARLEDADYRGHSLTMLQRIALALDKQVEVRFRPRHAGRTRAPRTV